MKELDKLANRTKSCLLLIHSRVVKSGQIDTDIKGTAVFILTSVVELYLSALATLRYPGGLAIICRSLIECRADAQWLLTDNSKINERCAKYVKAAKELNNEFAKVAKENSDNLSQMDIGQLTEWTTSTIEQRIKSLGSELQGHYDFMSYFTHVHPGKFNFVSNDSIASFIKEWLYAETIYFALSISLKLKKCDIYKTNEIQALENLYHAIQSSGMPSKKKQA